MSEGLPKIIEDEPIRKKSYKIGTHLEGKDRFLSLGTSDKHPIWFHDKNRHIWDIEAISKVRNYLSGCLGVHYTKNLVSSIVTWLRDRSYRDNVELGGPPHKMIMVNGVFDLDSNTFTPFENIDEKELADEYHITSIPVVWDAEAECPNIQEFLREVTENEDDIRAIEEFAGYCLLKDYPIAYVLVLVGEGSNGKSTLLDVIRAFLGKGNVTGISPHQLQENRFKLAQLHGKLANVAGDIGPKTLNTEIIKWITGGDWINAEHKNQAPFDFLNYAKQIFSCNKLPKVYDDTTAYHRRMRVVRFLKVFPMGDPNTKPKDKLVATMTTQEELSGFFKLAVGGLRRLRSAGILTGDKPAKEKRIDYKAMSGRGVQYFVERFLYHDPTADDKTAYEKQVVYDLYVQVVHALVRQYGFEITARTKRSFGPELKRLVGYIESGRRPKTALGPSPEGVLAAIFDKGEKPEATVTASKPYVWRGLGIWLDELVEFIELPRPARPPRPLPTLSSMSSTSNKEEVKRTSLAGLVSPAPDTDDLFDDPEEGYE